jgi:hypothetical protein
MLVFIFSLKIHFEIDGVHRNPLEEGKEWHDLGVHELIG